MNPQVFLKALQELEAPLPTQQPMFTREQINERIRENNALMNLGVVGQLSGDAGIQGVGGQVFKKALGDRGERVTNRGVTDPLTGETRIDPEYAEEKETGRRARVFEKALAYEGQRMGAQEREAENRRRHGERLEEIRARASQGRATDAEMLELRKELLRAQVDATNARVDTAGRKVADAADKKRLNAESATQRAKMMVSTIDKALTQVGPMSTGIGGAVMRRVPGSEASDLVGTVDTIKANIGFRELQAMREASPTGGALGQVAIRELDMLQATLGNIDPRSQSGKQVKENLAQVRQHYQNWLDAVTADAQDRSVSPDTPGVSPTPGMPQQPAPAPAGALPPPVPAQAPPGGASRRVRLDANGRVIPQ